ncbi:MAG: hypothetical protein CME31_24270 [Gimesia sp.]|nr:hypothetical protein [Gimesia sp.]
MILSFLNSIAPAFSSAAPPEFPPKPKFCFVSWMAGCYTVQVPSPPNQSLESGVWNVSSSMVSAAETEAFCNSSIRQNENSRRDEMSRD